MLSKVITTPIVSGQCWSMVTPENRPPPSIPNNHNRLALAADADAWCGYTLRRLWMICSHWPIPHWQEKCIGLLGDSVSFYFGKKCTLFHAPISLRKNPCSKKSVYMNINGPDFFHFELFRTELLNNSSTSLTSMFSPNNSLLI